MFSIPSGASERHKSLEPKALILPWVACKETGWQITGGIPVGRLQGKKVWIPRVFPMALPWGQKGEEGGAE